MSEEELQRRRAARLRAQIDKLEQHGAIQPPSEAHAEIPTKPPSTSDETAESRRKAPSAQPSPREFIHRRMRELDADKKHDVKD